MELLKESLLTTPQLLDFVDDEDLTPGQRGVVQMVRNRIRQAFNLGVAELYLRSAWQALRTQFDGGAACPEYPGTYEDLAWNLGNRSRGSICRWFGKNLARSWLHPSAQLWANLVVVMTELNHRRGTPRADWEQITPPASRQLQLNGWRNALWEGRQMRPELERVGLYRFETLVGSQPTERPDQGQVNQLACLFGDPLWLRDRRRTRPRRNRLADFSAKLRVQAEILNQLDRHWGDSWILCNFVGLSFIQWC